PAPILLVVHVSPDAPSLLPQVLGRHAAIAVKAAENGEIARPGVLYVAPSDLHLLIERGGRLRTVRGPRENRHRPAVDPLFRSAAMAFGPRAIAVVLSGSLDDGTAGLVAIKQRGGIALVQEPSDALFPSMPASAIAHVEVDRLVTIATLGETLEKIVNAPFPEAVPTGDGGRIEMEKKIAAFESETLQVDDRPGNPSAFSCPDCGGVLWEIEEHPTLVRYRCRVGHALSPETMLTAQDDKLEEALWTALKTLEESARLSKRLAETQRKEGHDWMQERFEAKERDARERAEVIRRVLLTGRSEVALLEAVD
ncbi:MAG TPA: chemotaxis protein CheB, partial [Thermoanaerobaculia bacterium]|nr:chemotaxis protein CheB [Thermoanaerobaculia bacterium]